MPTPHISREARTVRTLTLVALLAGGCELERGVALDFSRREPPRAAPAPVGGRLRVAVGAIVGPEATWGAYAGLVSLVAERLGRRADLVQRRTYAEVNRMLLSGEVDVALVCTGAYVSVRERVRFLAAPVINGSASYHSYIVTRAGGPASVAGLRGVRFAFTDPLSNTGRLYPIFLLRTEHDAGPRDYFATTVYSGGHDESIQMLLDRHADAAAVDGAIFDAFARAHPGDAARLSIIHRSPPFGSPPWVARSDLAPALADAVRDTLLRLHLDPAARAVLERTGIERFSPTADYGFAARVAEVALGGDAGEGAP